MKEKIIMLSLYFLLFGCSSAMASREHSGSCDGYKGKLLNACHNVVHPKRDHPRGVGADILIHETKHADFVAEYKYDGENKEHSIFAIVKTKKSLVDYAKDLINKLKGE